MRYFTILTLFIFIFSSCSGDIDQVEKSRKKLEELQKKTIEYQKRIESPTLMHSVYIWLKPDLSISDEKDFLKGCESLGNITSVSRMRMGKPASTENRKVVDQSYSYALNIEFTDINAQDAYQIDPIHLKFIEDNKEKWEKVLVYDNRM